MPTDIAGKAGTDAEARTTGEASTHPGGHHGIAHGRGRAAADRATHRSAVHIDLPVLGAVTLPPADQLAYVGGIAVLVALGVLEWPVGALLSVGHLLATDRHNKLLADFGEALEEA
jgi:hypothetical protein